jgi:D-3-phosphoglycerate dehydrogenase
MRRILIADPLAPCGLDILRQSGAEVQELDDGDRARIAEVIGGFDALIVRSRTKVDAPLLRAARGLRVIGRAGIGVDNVDVATATELGVLVVNAPTANLLSATEHTFALLLALVRNISPAHRSLLAGEWERKRFVGIELNGKTLGVIGLGRIGQHVAHRAKAFGMSVVAFDPFLDPSAARRLEVPLLSLAELLATADVVTLHTPLTEHTRNLLSADAITALKPGALLVNCARGGIVDESALYEALESGRLRGAALDVFAEEPPPDRRLIEHPNVVATPHIGAQTREAQDRVASETAEMVVAALAGSLELTAVNLPIALTSGLDKQYLALAEQLGSLTSALLSSSVLAVQVELWGIEESVRRSIALAALKGALTPFLGEAINFVNAEKVAESRGIELVDSAHHSAGEYPKLVGVTVRGDGGEMQAAGTVFGEDDARVVRFEGYRLEFRPKGRLLVLRNRDVPGVVGKVGTLLGESGLNIAEIHLARQEGGAEAIAVLRIDQEPTPEILAQLRDLPEVNQVRIVELPGGSQ